MHNVDASPLDIVITSPAVPRTEKELREVILDQICCVRNLKANPEIEEATRELVSLKEYRTVTGSEWSDLREEGPILNMANYHGHSQKLLEEITELNPRLLLLHQQ